MDFFEAQEVARKKTSLLVFYYLLAIVGIIIAVYALLVVLLTTTADTTEAQPLALWQPGLLLVASIGSLAVILLGSGFKVLHLASGGARVAQELGGRRISADTTDPDERRLLNVVEEMAIASGTPVPDVYLLEDEEGINAFAAGYSPSDAVIGVTRGCIQQLSRDELQGVIAHEFSHVLNGDMRLNIRLMGLLFGIVMLTVLGRIILRSGAYSASSNRKGNGGAAILFFGLGLLVIGGIGAFFARLIQAAVSRQREFLADASAVQFTRLPDGIAGALKRIGGLTAGSRIVDPHAEGASHMFFADGMAHRLSSALATHPPLPARIRAIQPNWDGKFLPPDAPASPIASRPRHEGRGRVAGFAAAPVQGAAAAALPHFRAPDEAQLAHAAQLHARLPQPWIQRARGAAGAQANLLGLLLSKSSALRDKQVRLLRGVVDEQTVAAALAAHAESTDLPSQQKLALIDLAIPALRRLSATEYGRFVDQLRLIVESDDKVDLFEFTLEKILQRHLDLYFHRRPHPKVRFTRLRSVAEPVAVLLSALARVGARGDAAAERHAFDEGAAVLRRGEPNLSLALSPPASSGLAAVGQALDQLELAAPLVKRAVLDACGQTVLSDGLVLEQEAELVRAIADALGTPLPVRLQREAAAASPASAVQG